MPQSITASETNRVKVVLVAASLGGVQALGELLKSLPRDFPVPIIIVQHRTTKLPNLLCEVLSRKTALRVKTVVPGEKLEAGTVYVGPPDRHVIVTGGNLALMDGRRIRHVLSSANPLFASAAQSLGSAVVAVVLTGTDSDAAEGVRAVKDVGGTVIVQDQETSQSFEMPLAAIKTGAVDEVLPLQKIGPELIRLTTLLR